MGREVRRVPADWQHPKNADTDSYQPLYDQDYQAAAQEWKDGFLEWMRKPAEPDCEYWDWEGGPPDREYYRPKWTEAEQTHYMMYETTSEGTPISPAFESPELLAGWLTDNNANAFAGQTATYEEWLRVANGGFACSAVISDGKLTSGVAAL